MSDRKPCRAGAEVAVLACSHQVKRGERDMTAFNVVRFRVKPGREKEFVAAQTVPAASKMAGFRRGAVIKTGDRTYCLIGEWDSFQNIVDARPAMIAQLDGFRGLLEDLGGGLGVTDPVSGEVVADLKF
jgi:hypothetical protein